MMNTREGRNVRLGLAHIFASQHIFWNGANDSPKNNCDPVITPVPMQFLFHGFWSWHEIENSSQNSGQD